MPPRAGLPKDRFSPGTPPFCMAECEMSPELRAGVESFGAEVFIRRLIAEIKLSQPTLGLVKFFYGYPG